MLVAGQDEPSRYLRPTIKQLTKIGGYRIIKSNFRGSYALVGYKGMRRPYWSKQVQNRPKRGPSSLSVRIPFGRVERTYTPETADNDSYVTLDRSVSIFLSINILFKHVSPRR